MVISATVAALVALGTSLISGGGVYAYEKNEQHKMELEYQEKIRQLQEVIAKLRNELVERDRIIAEQAQKIFVLDEKILESDRELSAVHEAVSRLQERQRALNSLFRVILSVIAFHYGKLKIDRREVVKALEELGNTEKVIEIAMKQFEAEKVVVIGTRDSARFERAEIEIRCDEFASKLEELRKSA